MRAFTMLLVAASAGLGQAPPPPPPFFLSTNLLTFAYEIGGPAPAPQVVSLEPEGQPGVIFVAASSDPAWLSVTPGTGTAPAKLRVSVNPAGFTPGTYESKIVVSGENTTVDVQVLRVLFVVRERPQLLPLSDTLSLTAEAGGARPAPATLYLTAKGRQVSFSASASSQGNWLAVSPASGQTPANLAVSVDPAGLAPNTYTGAITISSPEASNSPRTVSVTLAVTAAAPSFAADRVMNAASFQPGPVSPGEIIVIAGSGLGPETLAAARPDGSGVLGNTLAETRVLFDGVAAPLLYSQARQLGAIVPYGVAGKEQTQIQVEYRGQRSAAVSLPVAAAAPGIFTSDASGKGQGAILNQDGSVNSPSNPAARNSIVVLYATGEGQTDPPGADGRIAATVLPKPVLAVSVRIGGQPAEVLYFGAAPGLVAGVMQLNVRVPDGFPPGNASPVVLSIGPSGSQPGVTLAVR